MKFYRCEKCGKIVCLVKETSSDQTCCGVVMPELVIGATDGSYEKHIPVYSLEKGIVWVRVGMAEHPMTDSHHIAWIVLETKNGYQLKYLKPCCYPETQFALIPHDEVIHIYAYCNLHGLWRR